MQPKRCVIHKLTFQFVTRPPSQDRGLFLSQVCSVPGVQLPRLSVKMIIFYYG